VLATQKPKDVPVLDEFVAIQIQNSAPWNVYQNDRALANDMEQVHNRRASHLPSLVLIGWELKELWALKVCDVAM